MPQSHANCPHAPWYTHIPRGLSSGQHNVVKLNTKFPISILRFCEIYFLIPDILNYTPNDIEKKVPFKRRCDLKRGWAPLFTFWLLPWCPGLAGHFATKALAYLALQSWTKVQGRTQTSHHSLGQDIGGISCEMSGLIARKVRNFSERKDLLLLPAGKGRTALR